MSGPDLRALALRVDALMATCVVPGVAASVLDPDGARTFGFGVTNVDHLLSVDATATVAARLAAEGRLDLDEPVRRYLPEFRVAHAAVSARVTVREPLFVPLEMTRHFAAEDVLYERVAAGHTVRDGTAVRVRGRLSESTNRDPVGGVRSTMTDLLRYARFHLGDGTAPDGARLLPAAALVAMREPRVEMGAAGHVGLAWFSTTAAAHEWSPTAGPSRT